MDAEINNLSEIKSGSSTEKTPEISRNGFESNKQHDPDVCNEPTEIDKASKPKPVAFCKFIVYRPKLAIGLTAGWNVFVVLLSGILYISGYDLLPIDFSSLPLDITDDPTYLRVKAWIYKGESGDILSNSIDAGGQRSKFLDNLNIFYQSDNVFTAANLQAISEFETKIESVQNYGNFCRSQPIANDCRKPLSIIRFFDGTFGSDPTYSDILGTLAAAQDIPILSQTLQYFLGKESAINRSTNTAKTSITRTAMFFGYPLTGYDELTGDIDEQKKEAKTFLADNVLPLLEEANANGLAGMKVYYTSGLIFQHLVEKQVIKDMLLALGSIFFIFCFMLLQTQSLLLTSCALGGIINSFVATNLVYRIVLDYRYFGIFHILSVFIVLGIGSDNVFVLNDTWRSTSYGKYDNLVDRMSACYRHASKAMFITSLTTFIAFMANAFNPMLAMSSFGLFSGILILVNYLSAITYFPCVIIVYHLYFEKWTWPCLRCVKKNVGPTATEEASERKNIVVRFFRGSFYEFVVHKIIRWLLLLFTVSLIVFSVYEATTLKPQEEQIKLLKDTNQLQIASNLNLESFRPSSDDKVIKVYIVWGLKDQDRSSCHISDSKCKGVTVWDDSFDLNPKPAQVALLKLCEKIKEMSDEEVVDLKIRRNPVTTKLEIKCFIENMNEFLTNEGNTSVYSPPADLSLPTSETKMDKFITAHPELYNTTISQSFYRYFETGLSYWLNNGFSGQNSYDFQEYSNLIGQVKDTFDTQPIINSTLNYGTRLRYGVLTVNTTLLDSRVGYEKGLVTVDAWENFIKQEVAKLPPSLSGGFQCTPEYFGAWHWLKVQKNLVISAAQGIIIGISLALVILTIATQNIIIGFLATLTIVCVTVTVIGIIPLAGWKLGVLESLNLSLVVGLAVDYVVHLADGYHVSKEKDRKGRVRDMLEHVGVSIVSGACTTLGASVFMLFAEILFFMQFGIFMFCTIGFSLLYSLLFFTVILGICGPENDTGSITPIIKWVKNIFTGRKKHDVDCSMCEGHGFHPPDFDNLKNDQTKY